MDIQQVEDSVTTALAAAYDRGAHSKWELEIVMRLELAMLGLEIRGVPRFWILVNGNGVRISAEVWIRPVRQLAKVISIYRSRRVKRA
jgi:hypothetical protein